MNSICDILIFKSPFEEIQIFQDKFKKIMEMFDTYIINSWLKTNINKRNNDIFNIYEYLELETNTKIIFSIQKDFSKNNYFPVWTISYYINEKILDKENIEIFLNDNIKFIYNVFFNDFFIDYNINKYKLNDYNKWKKIDYDKLNIFDLENKKSDKNKQLLDSMMYIYFNLIKNIFDIKSNSEYIENVLINQKLKKEFEAKLELFKNRGDIIKRGLIEQSLKVKEQIDTFINFIS